MQCGTIRIMVSRHSAFYTPLIATVAAGFLEAEGAVATYDVLRPGQRSHALLKEGVVDVVQSAPSSNWAALERGETDLPVHFALINRRDGFFLAGRDAVVPFEWKALEGKVLLADHGRQPLVMLRYAAHCNGVDWGRINVRDAGSPEEMEAEFRAGRGDYVHLQGPAAQRLEAEGVGPIVASVGEAMPAVAFSSLMATREFLGRVSGRRFLSAYAKAKEWVNRTAAVDIAVREAAFFPGVAPVVLSSAVARYQTLGCWHGGLEIPHDLYEQALEVFLHSGAVTRRYAYQAIVALP